MTRTGTGSHGIQVMDRAAPQISVERLFLRSRAEIENLFAGLEPAVPLDDLVDRQVDGPTPPGTSALLGGAAFQV
jgi:hypothetical protein